MGLSRFLTGIWPREEGFAVGVNADVVDGDDVGMLEVRGNPRLMYEAYRVLRLERGVGQHRHGHDAAGVLLADLQDQLHAPLGDNLENLVFLVGGSEKIGNGLSFQKKCLIITVLTIRFVQITAGFIFTNAINRIHAPC